MGLNRHPGEGRDPGGSTHGRSRLKLAGVPAFAGTTVLLLLAFLFLAAPAAAQTFPELTGRVVDQANLLSPAQEADLTGKSAALEQRTGRQFAVATVNSLEGRTIEDYGYRLGRHWGIGSEEEDDGVILLVAPNEKKVRIETGYGARVFLTDVVSGRIVRNTILPRFREGDMAGGIIAGAGAIVEQMSLSPEQARQRAAEAAEAEAEAQEGAEWFAVPLVVGGMIVGFVLLAMARGARGQRYHRGRGRRRRRRRGFDAGDAAILLWGLSSLGHGSRGGWGGGGFGGFGGGGGFGGFSGGGGSFGGGGASGGW